MQILEDIKSVSQIKKFIIHPSIQLWEDSLTQWPSETNVALLTAQLWFDPGDRISHYPLESENPLSSSPNAHQTCQSNPTALSHMGQLRHLERSACIKKKKEKASNFTFSLRQGKHSLFWSLHLRQCGLQVQNSEGDPEGIQTKVVPKWLLMILVPFGRQQ